MHSIIYPIMLGFRPLCVGENGRTKRDKEEEEGKREGRKGYRREEDGKERER